MPASPKIWPTRSNSAEHLADTGKRRVRVYNYSILWQVLGHIPPLQAVKNRSRKMR